MRKILGSNAKLAKRPDGLGEVLIAGVTMAPAKRSGVNVCKHATAGCIAACVLWFAGRTVTEVVRRAAIARALLWANNPVEFYNRLYSELGALVRKAEKLGAKAYVRLNVASDIEYPAEALTKHPQIQFYDYTKFATRALRYSPEAISSAGYLPRNYQLTYSVNERTKYVDLVAIIKAGGNVALVVDCEYCPQHSRYGALPATIDFHDNCGSVTSVPVVDGDLHDIRTREFDGQGVVVGLRLKGTLASKESARVHGFAHFFQHKELVKAEPTICNGTHLVVALKGGN